MVNIMLFRVYKSGLGNEYVYEGGKAICPCQGSQSRSYENIVAKLATIDHFFTAKFYTQ